MWKIISLLGMTLLLAGCDKPITSSDFNNAKNVSNFAHPVKVGTLPDGREVKMVIAAPTDHRDMAIFFTDDNPSVTAVEFKTRQNGKVKEDYTETQVFINGSKYSRDCKLASDCKATESK